MFSLPMEIKSDFNYNLEINEAQYSRVQKC